MSEDNNVERRLHAFVSGDVQGVGYRYFAMSAALDYGLTGWVRNLSDGSVEVIVEGIQAKLEAYLAQLQRGPRSGRVEEVRSSWYPSRGEFDRFEIRF